MSEYQNHYAFGRSSLLGNRTEYHVSGGLEEMTSSGGLEYKHEMLHGEYESSE